MAGIFGPSPAEIGIALDDQRQERTQKRMQQSFQPAPGTSVMPGIFAAGQAGSAFGRAIRNATTGGDPRMRKAQINERIKQEFMASGLDIESEEGQKFILNKFMEAGDFDSMMSARKMFNAAQMQKAQLGTAQNKEITTGVKSRIAVDTEEAEKSRLKDRSTAQGLAVTQAEIDIDAGRLGIDRLNQQIQTGKFTQRSAQIAARKAALELARIPLEQSQAREDVAVKQLTKIDQDLGRKTVQANFAVIQNNIAEGLKLGPDQNLNDHALVIALTKVLDPSSVTRESEIRAVQNAGGLSDTLRNGLMAAMNGGKLQPGQRKQILLIARNRLKSVNQTYNAYESNILRAHSRRGRIDSQFVKDIMGGKAAPSVQQVLDTDTGQTKDPGEEAERAGLEGRKFLEQVETAAKVMFSDEQQTKVAAHRSGLSQGSVKLLTRKLKNMNMPNNPEGLRRELAVAHAARARKGLEPVDDEQLLKMLGLFGKSRVIQQ